MKRHLFASGAAAILSFGVAAFAQTTGQNPPTSGQSGTQPRSPQSQSQAAPEQVTMVGCIESASDYSKAHGGTKGTSGSAGDDFVLVHAIVVPAGGTASGSGGMTGGTGSTGSTSSSGSTGMGTSGTSGSASSGSSAGGRDYALTGSHEKDVSQYNGQRVQITGNKTKSSSSSSGTSGYGTSGTSGTSGSAQSASDLPEFEVISVQVVPGACPP